MNSVSVPDEHSLAVLLTKMGPELVVCSRVQCLEVSHLSKNSELMLAGVPAATHALHALQHDSVLAEMLGSKHCCGGGGLPSHAIAGHACPLLPFRLAHPAGSGLCA